MPGMPRVAGLQCGTAPYRARWGALCDAVHSTARRGAVWHSTARGGVAQHGAGRGNGAGCGAKWRGAVPQGVAQGKCGAVRMPVHVAPRSAYGVIGPQGVSA
ncbi:hypothetical protein GCM10009850_077950 [Nonomuraea monospora]|uniref:Uncharacterized protein n=1 Tax=Nonomuraea monospora TaxID=568818 RepID=A0ABN3CS98_9ACTN